MTPPGESPSKELLARIDELVHRTEALPDPHARASAIELVQGVMALHASVLARMLEIISATASGAQATEALLSDDLVSSVLVLHGLHPEDLETRVRRAVDKLRLFFDSRGGRIELLASSSELVRVRVTLARPGSGAAAKQVIEDAIYEAAAEVTAVVIEGADDDRRDAGFVPLADLLAAQNV